jgi:hypothetical protein
MARRGKSRPFTSRQRRLGNDAAYLKKIRQLPSCLSGRVPCDPHHLRIAEERGVGMRATDRWAVPLTRDEHIAVHECGGRMEQAWFLARGVDCRRLAEQLWQARDLSLGRLRQIIEGRGLT